MLQCWNKLRDDLNIKFKHSNVAALLFSALVNGYHNEMINKKLLLHFCIAKKIKFETVGF